MRIESKEWLEISALLDRVLDLPPDEREPWVQRLQGPDAVWAPKLLHLLRSARNSRVDSWFDTLPKFTELAESDVNTTCEAAEWPERGVEIGPYRLVRLLGRGGMGSVWFAERSDGLVRRGVALKLPLGLNADAILAARFAREREILAGLVHVHIARLYDAGIADNGQPYLALEYVEGVPLDAFCDSQCLDLAARLRLFRQVLDAVQYAHSRLVIHRDLKPANILVTAQGEVRLLDFGVAKLLDDETADQLQLTSMGSVGMTLNYASPEQVANRGVSTATDIYSLGVVLFELLVGCLPYRPKRGSRAALEDAILDGDIPLPSAVVGKNAADARSTTPKRLASALRGDLDAIILKMLNRSPELRYATVAAVAEDLIRYSDGDTVKAHKPSRWYWLRKFVGRNRLVVVAASLVAIAVLTGAALAVWQAREAGRQAQLASAERDRALAAAEHREAVDEFMSDLLLDAGRTGKPISIANLVSRADQLSAQEFRSDPEARAAVLATVGVFASEFDGLGKALDYFSQSQKILVDSRDDALRVHVACNRNMLRALLGEAADGARELQALIADPRTPSSVKSECLGYLAKLAVLRFDGPAATRAAQQALDQWQISARRSPKQRLELLAYQAEALAVTGKLAEADASYAAIVDGLRQMGRERSDLGDMVRTDRYVAALASGNLVLALQMVDDSIASVREDAPDHTAPVLLMYERCLTLIDLGRYSEALTDLEKVATLAASSDRVIMRRARLDAAVALSRLGRRQEAESRYLDGVAGDAPKSPEAAMPSDISALLARAKLDLDERQYSAVRRNMTLLMTVPGLAHSTIAAAHRIRATAALEDGDFNAAQEDARAGLSLSEKERGDQRWSAWVGETELILGRIFQATGNPGAARAAFGDAVEQFVETVGNDAPDLREARRRLAMLPPARP